MALLHAVVEGIHADGKQIVGLIEHEGLTGGGALGGEGVCIGAFEDLEPARVEHAVINLRIEGL